ncbi:MAG TPA: AI-2E family transporter [Oscillospiraceae bacterium]|nr:AI-2E family transporter [Oscillospiraceae bacterium]HPF56852.1 AI-2E family transporter [Clostridiales bacterium]HPK36364.1 AI-2E family transporter [Oscillospiraceae bacterium]HPR76862.1 AI-2E family transporter [Oscillospiraceae bacterium]
MKKFFAYFKTPKVVTGLIVTFCGILFYLLLSNITGVGNFFGGVLNVLSPFIWAAIFAYILNPAVKFFEDKAFRKMKRRKAAHILSVIISYIAAIAVLVLLVVLLIPQLADSIMLLINNLEGYFNGLRNTLVSLEAKYAFLDFNVDEFMGSFSEWIKTAVTWISDNIGQIADASVKVGSSVFNFFLSLILSIYILLDKQHVRRIVKRVSAAIVKRESWPRFRANARRADRIFTNFLAGNIIDAVIVGVATFLFMVILGLPYPVLLSAIIMVTNFIPTFGPIIGAVPCLLIIVLVNPLDALWFLIWIIVIQTIDGNLLKPLLFGDYTGLRPIWVLISIVLCGRLFGIAGMILGIPLFAVLSEPIENAINRRLGARGLDENGDVAPEETAKKEPAPIKNDSSEKPKS